MGEGRRRGWPVLATVVAALIAAVGAVVAALIAAVGAVVAALIAAYVSEQGQVPDRVRGAVSQLADPNPEVRLAGVDALERVASDSPRDQATVVELLAEHVRRSVPAAQSPACRVPATPSGSTVVYPAPPADALAAVTVLAQRNPAADAATANLAQACLPNTRIVLPESERSAPELNLAGAVLTGADLRGTHLRGADLAGADLTGAHLGGADLAYTTLTGADLTRANLTEANLTGADLTGAVLRGARGVNLSHSRGRPAVLPGG